SIQAVLPFIRNHVETSAIVILGSKPQETERSQLITIAQFICGQLELHKLIVGQITVERADDPIPILEGIGIKKFGIGANLVRLILRVASERQPDAREMFAKTRRSQ